MVNVYFLLTEQKSLANYFPTITSNSATQILVIPTLMYVVNFRSKCVGHTPGYVNGKHYLIEDDQYFFIAEFANKRFFTCTCSVIFLIMCDLYGH